MMVGLQVLVLFLSLDLLCFSSALSFTSNIHEDATLTVTGLIEKYGYIAEKHHVITEDGYILEMHRIRGSKASPRADGKPVVFLMHGLLSSSVDFVIMGPGKGLGYILADSGYDVWMGNARGNTYSKNHTTITNTSKKSFYDFSWHEIGYYDLPTMIDHVLEQTNKENLIYIGFSQGTTVFWVMNSLRPEYNDKITAMIALAPVAYTRNLKSPFIRLLALSSYPISILMNLVGLHEFMPSSTLTTVAGQTFCNDDSWTQFMCSNVLFLIAGFNKEQLNTTAMPVLFAHTPAGASSRQIFHYTQGINSGKFREYDHGYIKNLMVYHSMTPPKYNLSLVTTPVHLMYSNNDWLAAVKDVKRLYRELGNPVELINVEDPKWNHLDFMYGINAFQHVYERVLSILSKYHND